jgi:hypothetical protein
MKLPKKYEWLLAEPGPKMLVEFLKIYGTTETPGNRDNPIILEWAKEAGIKDYKHDRAKLGDILVFKRTGGGHVGLYIGEDDECYHCLGGNQGDTVNIVRKAKNRIYAIRRPHYNNQPANVRKVILSPEGHIDSREA